MKFGGMIKRVTAITLSVLLASTATVWPAHAQGRTTAGRDAAANTNVAGVERGASSLSSVIEENPRFRRGFEIRPGIQAQVTSVSGDIAHVRITGRDARGPLGGEVVIVVISEPGVSANLFEGLVAVGVEVFKSIRDALGGGGGGGGSGGQSTGNASGAGAGNCQTTIVVNGNNNTINIGAGTNPGCVPQ